MAAVRRDIDLRGNSLGAVLDVQENVLGHARHTIGQRQRSTTFHQVGTSGDLGVEPFHRPVVDRQHMVAARLDHAFQLFRMLCCKIGGQAEILGGVEQFPFILVQRPTWLRLPWRFVDGARPPALAIDRAVAEHLEVLCGVPFCRPRIIE